MKPVQEIDLAENFAGIIEYPLQAYKWGDVYSVSIYIPQNWGADKTVVTFIGFKGSCEEVNA